MGSVLQVEVSLCPLVGDVLGSNSGPHHPPLDWLELGGGPGKMLVRMKVLLSFGGVLSWPSKVKRTGQLEKKFRRKNSPFGKIVFKHNIS